MEIFVNSILSFILRSFSFVDDHGTAGLQASKVFLFCFSMQIFIDCQTAGAGI